MATLGPAEKFLSAAFILTVMGQFLPWYILTAVVIGVIVHWYRSTKYEFEHWTRMGVAGPGASQPFPQASFFEAQTDAFKFDNEKTAKYGSIFGYHMFGSRVVSVGEPELIKRIFVKDFDHFIDRINADTIIGKHSLMGKMFSVQSGERWKVLRNTLTPAFTSGKMKHMPFYIHQSLQRLDKVLMDYVNKAENVPLKNTMGRFTLDTVAAISFALDIEAQTREDNPFVMHSKELINIKLSDPGIYFQMLAPNLANMFTYYTGISVLKHPSEQFFRQSNRPDFLQLCLNSQKMTDENIEHDAEIMFEDYKKAAKAHMTDDELIAQSALFLAVGFDTTAVNLELVMYLLTTHPEVQETCRQEIREKCGTDPSKFTFDQIMHLDYVDAVFCETQRKFPVAFRGMRMCNKDITYSDYGITINKGDAITVPVYYMHHDPANYPEPEKFLPERFLGDAKTSRDPYTYLPFGAGPRNCIGMRFAQLEMKQTIAHILTKYRLMPCEDTPPEPLNLEVTSLIKPKDIIKVKIEPL